MKKVFVSGCYDCFHAGHIRFLNKAAEFGELYVAVGSDKTVLELKHAKPTFSEDERLLIVSQLKSVKNAFISSGSGMLDFENELREIMPDMFIVNYDGNTPDKKELCEKLGIEYKVIFLERSITGRSSTQIKAIKSKIPYRIDLAGGWLDQPYVSKYFPGPVLTISIEPHHHFNFKSGMASSTRNRAIKLWGNTLPEGDPKHLANILFCFDNPPGVKEKETAGAQDSIGIMVPGLTYSFFKEKHWPIKMNNILDENILKWIEERIYLIELEPRKDDYFIFDKSNINEENARSLSQAAEECFQGIINNDFEKFAKSFRESFDAQIKMFPSTCPKWIHEIIEKYKNDGVKGWKLSGAGGGGYLILASETPIENAIKIKIRRK